MIDYRRRMRLNLAVVATGLALFAVFPFFANSGLVFLAGLVAINICLEEGERGIARNLDRLRRARADG